jgi:hypothetical protein
VARQIWIENRENIAKFDYFEHLDGFY